jgi:hypothetical protein
MKICPRCKDPKELSEFHKDKRRKDGHTVYCKQCLKLYQKSVDKEVHNQRNRDYRKSPKGKSTQNRHNITEDRKLALRAINLSRYGMTLEQWEEIFDSQGRKCAACGSPEPHSLKGWHVDHCHLTEKVCGILCGRCNTGLGMFGDDPKRILMAYEYALKTRKEAA